MNQGEINLGIAFCTFAIAGIGALVRVAQKQSNTDVKVETQANSMIRLEAKTDVLATSVARIEGILLGKDGVNH